MTAPETSLTASPSPPAAPPIGIFFQGSWEDHAASGIAPRVASQGRSDATQRAAFAEGFRLLRLDLGKRGALPQQLRVVDCLAAGTRYAAILLPRQSAKTTSVEVYLLGLCALLPGVQIAYIAATTGKAGRDHVLKKVFPPLEALYRDPDTRPFQLRKAAGQERIIWDNGSLFQVCATPDDFRGSSFDIIWVDEAGELEGQYREDLLGAAQPTQDTRSGLFLETPLLILSGTAGESREGNALWDFLELGRAGDPDVSILEYSAGVDLTVEDFETWELTEPLILASHPGVGTLTPLATIHSNYKTMTREQFGREYLGIFTDTNNSAGILNPGKWEAGDLNQPLPAPPEKVAFAMVAHRHQTSACIAAAWRDADGVAYVILVDYRDGTDWLPGKVATLHPKHPRKVWAHEAKGTIKPELAVIEKHKSRPRLMTIPDPKVADAAALFVREVHTGKLKHYGQKQLTEAALIARRREYGKGFYFGSGGTGDTVPLEAAALALYAFDTTPEKKPLPRMTL